MTAKCALASDAFKKVVHICYPGRNKAAAMVLFPASIGEKTCITDHRKVLIRDVADKTSNKSVNLQCHVTGLCAVGIIFIAKANDLAIIVNDSIFR